METTSLLVVNAGSSSLKFSVFAVPDLQNPQLLVNGQIERIGTSPRLITHDAAGAVLIDRSYAATDIRGHDDAIQAVAGWLGTFGERAQLTAAGHRVVHGGPDLTVPVMVDDAVLARLEQLVKLMPLHLPANLAAIRALRKHVPNLPQVACFDTSFHRLHTGIVDRFALPGTFYEEGVRRYGFHGLSYEYIARRLPEVAPEIAHGRVIVAHLGSGASMCALRDGQSVDSTMAFSALDGLPMNTRSGALDPGVVIYLVRDKGMSVDDVESLLYRQSGLHGLSGFSGDMRDLLASDKPNAKLAVDYFVFHGRRQIGALSAVLEGLDAIVFTAGIGEHSPEIRERICDGLSWLGIALDRIANRDGGPRITKSDARVSAWVIPTNEELVIAWHMLALGRRRSLEP